MALPNPGWNVVYGEIPAASKWSQLGANDDALAAGTGLNDLAIVTAKLADSAATTRKIKPSIIDWLDPGVVTNPVVTGAAMQDVSGISTTYTTGPTAEKVLLIASFMCNGSGGNYGMFATLSVNGTDLDQNYHSALNGLWTRMTFAVWATIPANTTATIKLRARTQAGVNVVVGRDVNDAAYRTTIRGLAISNA